MGWSNGKWEGDTLVIAVNGFNDLSWFDRAGNHHSDALLVTERYALGPGGNSSTTRRGSRIRRPSPGPGRSACRSTAGWIETRSSSSSTASNSRKELLYGDVKKKPSK
jgi:hypothetical protein